MSNKGFQVFHFLRLHYRRRRASITRVKKASRQKLVNDAPRSVVSAHVFCRSSTVTSSLKVGSCNLVTLLYNEKGAPFLYTPPCLLILQFITRPDSSAARCQPAVSTAHLTERQDDTRVINLYRKNAKKPNLKKGKRKTKLLPKLQFTSRFEKKMALRDVCVIQDQDQTHGCCYLLI